jgi:hypothetical protein
VTRVPALCRVPCALCSYYSRPTQPPAAGSIEAGAESLPTRPPATGTSARRLHGPCSRVSGHSSACASGACACPHSGACACPATPVRPLRCGQRADACAAPDSDISGPPAGPAYSERAELQSAVRDRDGPVSQQSPNAATVRSSRPRRRRLTVTLFDHTMKPHLSSHPSSLSPV